MKRVLVAAAACTALSSCNPFADPFLDACEQALKERLRSPATYERVEVDRAETPLNRQEYEAYLKSEGTPSPEIQLTAFDKGYQKPTSFKAYIRYDAANAFGTPVRGFATCEYTSSTGTAEYVSYFTVTIDGLTNTEWLIEGLKKT